MLHEQGCLEMRCVKNIKSNKSLYAEEDCNMPDSSRIGEAKIVTTMTMQ